MVVPPSAIGSPDEGDSHYIAGSPRSKSKYGVEP